MTVDWEIGKEARELDEKSILERAKIEKRSIKRIIIAFICYILTMILFYFLL
ncbi:MAG: hypothetical protein ACFFCE_11940 [Promethearchaeota archaeon]